MQSLRGHVRSLHFTQKAMGFKQKRGEAREGERYVLGRSLVRGRRMDLGVMSGVEKRRQRS